MKIRVNRRHLYGNSNYNRTLSIQNRKSEKFSDLNKNKKFSAPIKESEKIRANSLITEPLKNKHKRKINFLNNRKLLSKNQKNRIKENLKRESKNKIFKNKIAYIETQIISQPSYAKKTKKQEFNIKKIFDFKKTLFRIYSKKKNVGKAFMNWDLTKKGYIDKNDVARMSKRLGIPLNKKESDLLISLADVSKDSRLNSKEFFSFITDNSFLKLYEKEILEMKGSEEKIKNILSEKLIKLESNKKYSDLIRILHNNQKEMNKLVNNRLIFKNKNFMVEKNKFISVMKNLNYDDKFLDEKKLIFIFERNKDKNEKVNFFDFVNNVNKHKTFEEFQPYIKNVELGLYFKQKNTDKNIYINPKSLTLNKIENLFKKIYKLRGRLNKKNLSKENLKKSFDDSKKKLNQKNVKNIFSSFLKKNKINFTEFEIKTLLSGLNYNSKNLYNLDSILNTVYNFNMDEFLKNQRKRESILKIEEKENSINLENIPINKIKNILKEVDFKLFTNKTTHFKFYKKLDYNKDKILSGKDIKEYLINKKITSEKNAEIFLKKMDIKIDKILSFKELHLLLSENFSNKNKLCPPEKYCNILGLKNINPELYLKNLENDKEYFENLKNEYRVFSKTDNCKIKRFFLF